MSTFCPSCVGEAQREASAGTLKPGLVHFSIDGVNHIAPEIWIVGRRQALEKAGDSPSKASWQACREWAEHCAELEAKTS